MSVSGCKKATVIDYCNGGDSGPEVGQVATITLSPSLATYGESLDFGQIGQSLSASATDCKGNAVSVKSYTYASTNLNIADINPATGQTCAGTWNRHTGGGVPDFTTCTAFTTANPPAPVVSQVFLSAPTPSSGATPQYPAGLASQTTLTLSGAADTVSGTLSLGIGSYPSHTISVPAGTSLNTLAGIINSDPVYKNFDAGNPTGPVVPITASYNATTFVLTLTGPAAANTTITTTGTALTDTNPPYISYVTATAEGAVSNAIPVFIHPPVTSITIGTPSTNCSTDPSTNCCPLAYTSPSPVPAPYTSPYACISQGTTALLVGRVYGYGGTTPSDNITCQVGHLSYSPQNGSNIVSIDENGVATANQPGSATITAAISQSGSASTAGFFSTCPPATIQLSAPGQTSSNFTVNLNNAQPLTAVVYDTNGKALNGINLQYNSTAQQTIPTSANSVTPTYPGVATITAVCLPPSCNTAPYSQINYEGNGVPLTSNGLRITTPGTSSTVLYVGSTSSQYVFPRDFTTNQPSSLIKLPYVPNSMIINQSGTTIFFGSAEGLMTLSTSNNVVGATNTAIVGPVISVSPDGNTLVMTDPNKKTVSLVSSSGNVTTTYGGVATRASWSPDAETVYITGTDEFGNPQLLVHSAAINWEAIPLTTTYTDAAVTVPHIGAYFAGGTLLDGRSYCPTSSSNNATSPPVVTNSFYPVADEKATTIDRIAATTDGNHVIGATATAPAAVKDVAVKLPIQTPCTPVTPTVTTALPPAFTSSITTYPLTGVVATAINNILPSNDSSLAFITYTGSSGILPVYFPATSGAGKLTLLQLGNGATTASAPVSGTFSTDNLTFFVGTSGDNQVHEISPNFGSPTGPTETPGVVINPALPCGVATCTGTATPNLIAQRPKKSTE